MNTMLQHFVLVAEPKGTPPSVLEKCYEVCGAGYWYYFYMKKIGEGIAV